MKYCNYLVVLFLFSTLNLFSQVFTANREKFIKEFDKSLADYGKGEYHDFAKRILPEALLESSEFSEKHFQKMVETCNLMLTKKLSPFPEIYNYVYSVYSLVHGKQSDASFYAWHSSVDKMLDSKNVKKFEDFIELSAVFFSHRIIAESPNFTWYYEGGTYSFEFTDKAFLKFENGNLICRVINRHKDNEDHPFLDSIHVAKTSGTFDPFLKKWVGNGGTITWEKVGLPADQTKAEIKHYELNCKMSTLSADSVMLTTPYFNKKIMGNLAERAFTINREEYKVFPEFVSYEKRLRIKDIRPDVDYDGGFALKGASFVGMGSPEEPARLLLYRNGKVFIKTSAQTVYIYPRRFSCNHAATTMFLNTGDSIYHPGLHFGYDLDKKLVELLRSDDATGQAPFEDSYHRLDCYVAKLSWKTDEQDIFWTYDFGTSQEQRYASFESKAYFDLKLYERLQALDKVHPLVALMNQSDKLGKRIITEGEAASALGRTIEQARPLLYELGSYGFVGYDSDAKTITINKKLIHFVNSKAQRIDYDNLIFNSDFRPKEIEGYSDQEIKDNANLKRVQEVYKARAEERRMMTYFGRMNLGTLELDLNAVDVIGISEMQQTMIYPEGSRVTVKQNRNFEFSGWINSGKMEMNALSASYNYNDNKFILLKTDKSLFRVRPMRPEDGTKSIATRGSINGIVGELLIDDPSNRSGNNKAISTYPKLIISKPCYVYYNSKSILRGAYDSTRFYYIVTPFEFDSLDNFDEKSFRLRGELVSARIFPKITTDLTIMPDYSFGFSTKAPPGGFDFYGTGAKYDNKIVLSNNGLQGEGTINFVESTSISKTLYFLPDSTIGYAKFTNRPTETGVQFPDVDCHEAYIVYMPKQKLLKASSTPNYDLRFFKGEAKLRGTAFIRPTGMNGDGLFTFKTATTISRNYRFNRWEINADTSSFSLKNTFAEQGESAIAFRADDVQAHISFKERLGEFKNNKGTSQVNFPVNQYMCRMDRFSWFMDFAELQLDRAGEKDVTIETDMDMVGPNFYSLHPNQDSLSFRVPKAKYDLKERSIYCEMVEYLDVADARIYPDSMKLIIRKNAKIEPLKKAKITANYITEYHNFVECDLEILARMNYRGKGLYPYYDRDSNLTNFYMESIFVDTTQQTEARGKIASDAKFYLSPQFEYYGDIVVKAALPTIVFKGATRINHDCDKFAKTWITFDAEIDPNNIQIPISPNMKDIMGNSIFSGLAWRNSMQLDSIKIYPVFMSRLVRSDDPLVMNVSGLLQYNNDAKEFQIGSSDKLLNRNEKGDFLALHTETCSLHGEGNINLGLDIGDIAIQTVGVADYNQQSNKTTMNLTMMFDLPVDKKAFEDVADRIGQVEGLKPMDMSTTTFEQSIVEWVDQKTADKIKSDYSIKGELKKMPEQMEKAIVLTGVKITSFDKSMIEKGLITVSETAVLLNMFEKVVANMFLFRAFFQQIYSEASPDKFALQIDIPGGRDYYFDYSMTKKDGDLKIISGDAEFCSAVNAIKEDKRKSKNFKYEISTQRVYLSKFLRLFGI